MVSTALGIIATGKFADAAKFAQTMRNSWFANAAPLYVLAEGIGGTTSALHTIVRDWCTANQRELFIANSVEEFYDKCPCVVALFEATRPQDRIRTEVFAVRPRACGMFVVKLGGGPSGPPGMRPSAPH
jgi:hypothetical protein